MGSLEFLYHQTKDDKLSTGFLYVSMNTSPLQPHLLLHSRTFFYKIYLVEKLNVHMVSMFYIQRGHDFSHSKLPPLPANYS